MIPLSVLDLSPILQGGTPAQAYRHTLDLAGHAERLGYTRFWLAEHHNMPGIGSSATSVLIGHVGAGTSRIRIGAGGIMLPNHAPLQIAEQFGTLESLFPGRIDLGLGRAPGTDRSAAIALRRTLNADPDNFPNDVLEVMASCPRICRYLHVPAQSGSDRILKLMNRGYSVTEYREFVDELRTAWTDALRNPARRTASRDDDHGIMEGRPR